MMTRHELRDRARAGVSNLLTRLPAPLGESMLVESVALGPLVFTPRSWLRLLALQKLSVSPGRLVALHVRGWDGQPVWVRSGTTDWESAHVALLLCPHRPPAAVRDVTTILDLGANIGTTVADLAAAFPAARVLGVELDAANVDLARRNVAAWGDRVSILHGAVWTEDGEIAYGGGRGEWAYQVTPAMDDRTQAPERGRAPAFSLTTLLDRLAPGAAVDYVKMDVEGAERFLLAHDDGWAQRVRCLQVEVHLPLDVESCSARLAALGFRTRAAPGGILSVTGWRDGAGQSPTAAP